MNNIPEYKGIYYKEALNAKSYEAGAHFKYKDLHSMLDKLAKSSKLRMKTKQYSLPKDKHKLIINKQTSTGNMFNTIEKPISKHTNSLLIKTNNFFFRNNLYLKNKTTSSAVNQGSNRINYSNDHKDRSVYQRIVNSSSKRNNSLQEPDKKAAVKSNNNNSSTNTTNKSNLYIKVNEKLTNNIVKKTNLTNKNSLNHPRIREELNIPTDNSCYNKSFLNTVTEPRKSVESKKDKKDDSQDYISTNRKSSYSTKTRPKESKAKSSVDKFNHVIVNIKRNNNKKICARLNMLNRSALKQNEDHNNKINYQIMIKFNSFKSQKK